MRARLGEVEDWKLMDDKAGGGGSRPGRRGQDMKSYVHEGS